MYEAETKTVANQLERIASQLADAGIVDPQVDAELLLAHVLGVTRGRVQALAVLGTEVDRDTLTRLDELTDERARRVPLQHLTGRAPFRQLELSVGPGVFVPRPETETVVQFAIDELTHRAAQETLIAVDLCTGSGAIALAMATEVPEVQVWAIERSEQARAWATRNITEWGSGRVRLLAGDVRDLESSVFAGTLRDLTQVSGRVDVLISNPPYVPDGMVPRDPEVRDHDPALALYGGADGLDLVRSIAVSAMGLVRAGGLLVLEHAEGQGAAICALLHAAGWELARTHPDLTGRDRATTARKPGGKSHTPGSSENTAE